jgi:apolipoprotein N-acyltransferase
MQVRGAALTGGAIAGPVGDVPSQGSEPTGITRAAWLRAALAVQPWRIDGPFVKFVLFALVPAVPAFRLHQLIAYGSAFGEYHSFGARAYLTAFLIWWASWAVTLVLIAGGLRAVVEAGTAATLWWHPEYTPDVRRALLGVARAAYFVGVPAWLLVRLLGP